MAGEIGLEVPRDRKLEFMPVVVKKRQRDISGLDEKIISMYGKGMTTRDMQDDIIEYILIRNSIFKSYVH